MLKAIAYNEAKNETQPLELLGPTGIADIVKEFRGPGEFEPDSVRIIDTNDQPPVVLSTYRKGRDYE